LFSGLLLSFDNLSPLWTNHEGRFVLVTTDVAASLRWAATIAGLLCSVEPPLKNGGQTNKTVSRSSEAAPLAVREMHRTD